MSGDVPEYDSRSTWPASAVQPRRLLRGPRGLGVALDGDVRPGEAVLPGADPGGGRAVPFLQRQCPRGRQAVPFEPRYMARYGSPYLGLDQAASGRRWSAASPVLAAGDDRAASSPTRSRSRRSRSTRRRPSGPTRDLTSTSINRQSQETTAMSDVPELDDFNGTARLFPLPNLVFFPARDAAAAHLRAALPADDGRRPGGGSADRPRAARPGWEDDYAGRPAIYPVACLGQIVAEQRLAGRTVQHSPARRDPDSGRRGARPADPVSRSPGRTAGRRAATGRRGGPLAAAAYQRARAWLARPGAVGERLLQVLESEPNLGA